MTDKRVAIMIGTDTRATLNDIGCKGDTYNDVINKLLSGGVEGVILNSATIHQLDAIRLKDDSYSDVIGKLLGAVDSMPLYNEWIDQL